MSWDNITGEQKIIPQGTGVNEVRFESGKAKRIRLLLKPGEEPYSYLEHALEVEKFENGQQVRTFRTIRCPKTSKNPNAICPLCDGQKVRRRIRNAANSWDYDMGSVQKLNSGETVWKPIATTRKMGIDVTQADWAVLKTGQDRNDTDYSTVNAGPCQNQMPIDEFIVNGLLFDIESDYAPHTIEEMKAIVESVGGDWNDLITPPELSYPSLEDALKHVMPNGQYKNQTMAQLWEADKSSKGMINFLACKSDRISPEKAAARVILVNLGGADIPGVPRNGQASAPTSAPTVQVPSPAVSAPVSAPASAPAPAQVSTQTATVTPVSADRQAKINQINGLLSSPKFASGGFAVIMDMMKRVSGGKTNIVEFTDVELDSMIAECNK